MGVKLNWTGLFITVAGGVVHIPEAVIVGAIIFLIGIVLMWLDK
jgi:hypothetical protein